MTNTHCLSMRNLNNAVVSASDHPSMGAAFAELDRYMRKNGMTADTLAGIGDFRSGGQIRDTEAVIGTWLIERIPVGAR